MIFIISWHLIIGLWTIVDCLDSCIDLVINTHLDKQTTTLVLEDLISIYHKNDLGYIIDLTCFKRLTRIEEGIKKPGYMNLISFKTGQEKSSNFTLEYEWKGDRFLVTVLITSVESIKSLVLNHNTLLTSIPAGCFRLLRNLTHLSLAWNQILSVNKKPGFNKLSFEGLEQLTHLDLSNNLLNFDIAQDSFALVKNLFSLDLSARLSQRYFSPESLVGLENLHSLNLSRASTNPSAVFPKLASLRILDISDHTISAKKSQLMLKNIVNLTQLIMLNCQFVESLKSSFFPINIEFLDLSSRNGYGGYMPSFQGLSKLKKLYLAKSILSFKFDGNFQDLFSDDVILTHLDLSENSYDSHVFNKVAFLNASLESLRLERNDIELLDTKSNVSLFYALKELYLRGNRRVMLNMSHFGELKNLKVLDLSLNQIDKLTVNSVRGLDRLEVLDLSDNYIRTIQNGSFASLYSLVRLDLRRNQIRNLYFYGLSYKCAIFHDGLSVFNMSSIDLAQISLARSESFLQKTLRLRGNMRLSFYRNIRVSWRSVSIRPDCSLYFYVLRKHRVISFDIDEDYIEECKKENLELRSFDFYQADFTVFVNTTFWQFRKVRPMLPKGFKHLKSSNTRNGYLIGRDNSNSIVTIKWDDFTVMNVFNTSKYPSHSIVNFKLISDQFILGCSAHINDKVFFTLWNITDKSNMTFLHEFKFTTDLFFADYCGNAGSSVFLVNHQVIGIFSNGNDLLCFINLATHDEDCRQAYAFSSKSFVAAAMLETSSLLVFSEKNLEIWNATQLYQKVETEGKIVEITLSSFIEEMYTYSSGQTDFLLAKRSGISQAEYGVWSLESNNQLSFNVRVAYKYGRDLGFAYLKSLRYHDTLIAFLLRDNPTELVENNFQVELWSLRYHKQVEIIDIQTEYRIPSFAAMFEQGQLLIDNFVYQF